MNPTPFKSEPNEPSGGEAPGPSAPTGKRLALLTLGALGIVYGDLGTSPLYSLRECFHGVHAVPPRPENVLGVLSLVFWALVVIVTIKYNVYVLAADNRGQGGVLALMALVRGKVDSQARRKILIIVGLFGAALLYGDGMITPAISVLSAVEGLSVATAAFTPYVVPITVGILVLLFAFQRTGTGGLGRVFGPIMLLWFGTLAVLGARWVVRAPEVFHAVNPYYAFRFFELNHGRGFLVLGAVFLVATGGEALYADLGHFGKKPIQIDWFLIVAPSLLLNYFGQGALLLHDPQASWNPFYKLAPAWALYPLVALATAATVIASQAVISGAFSLTHQAVQLGYLPRTTIIHTSEGEIGQIYVPAVNWLIAAATVGLVLSFRSSSRLAAAYGIAVTTTMVITTLLAHIVAHRIWRWPAWAATAVTLSFLAVDLSFFGANAIKFRDGGWVPIVVGILVFAQMSTWERGRCLLAEKLARDRFNIREFIAHLEVDRLPRNPRTAIYMARDPEGVPSALLHNLKHNGVLHDRILLLNVENLEAPQASKKERLEVVALGRGFYQVCVRFGFMDTPDVPEALTGLPAFGLDLSPMKTTYFLGKETLIPKGSRGMWSLRKQLFALMARNSQTASRFFHLPPNRVIELGQQLEF
ncbi:MAG TPA: potassium transporter Kup [Thermoanaerobaculia bacterium]|jgi:KUP system potassium uptake protein|nr:potassium transporter Kup [Thermoanaerobaculia bacterium]